MQSRRRVRLRSRIVVAAALVLTANAAFAASSDFYRSLLRRGVSHYAARSYDAAARELRIASFGLVDNLAEYETANIYLALTSEELGIESDAREGIRKVVAAERIGRVYAKLPLPVDVRERFERTAARITTADQLAVLRGGAAEPPVAPPERPSDSATRPLPEDPPGASTAPRPSDVTSAPIYVAPAPSPVVQPMAAAPTPSPAVQVPSADAQRARTAELERQRQELAAQRRRDDEAARVRREREAAARAAAPISTVSIASKLTEAEAAVDRGDLANGRARYQQLLTAGALDHASLLRVAEGLYRTSDFRGALAAFTRAGELRSGEEPYRYYLAVALYETAQYVAARRELERALPYVELTPEVARYRAKIEGAASR